MRVAYVSVSSFVANRSSFLVSCKFQILNSVNEEETEGETHTNPAEMILFLSLVREAGVWVFDWCTMYIERFIQLHCMWFVTFRLFVQIELRSIGSASSLLVRQRRHQTHFIQGSEFFYELLQWELIFSLSFLPLRLRRMMRGSQLRCGGGVCLCVNTIWAERNEMTRRQELCWSWGDMSTINIRHRKRNKTLNFCPIPK